ncbi:shikimate kinase [Streptomyces sp. NPDC085524]|uniref:shikimate kinase n=1 Tax=Streptomyces sp. NPDC085524 TaxID=3365728 RepID=UPI0037D0A6C3
MTGGPLAVLVGPMGVGKSTVGALLAERLGAPFRDTDRDVESGTGRSVRQIITGEGERRFRELEHLAVVRAVAEDGGVLALGGGAVLHAGTRARLAGLPVAFLDIGVGEAMKRVGEGTDRPLLAQDPQRRWQELHEERRDLYVGCARVVIPTDRRAPEDVVQAVIDALELKKA